MDFFQHQDIARRNTALFVFYFLLAVLLINAGVYAVFSMVYVLGVGYSGLPQDSWWDPQLFLMTTAATLAVIALGTLYKTVQLASGGGVAVAESLGGAPVDPGTHDPLLRRLINVVEEMAIASGTVVPTIYVLNNEPQINAFAAGTRPDNAVVAVTRGTLEQLSRDELQGVIAHEFSHIFNGDMRLNLRLMGVLHGILIIALIGQTVLRGSFFGSHHRYRSFSSGSSRRSGKGAGGIMILALSLLVIGYVGMFFGNLIKSAVSRQREFLADASAVQFTRNPDGIASALKKIGGMAQGGELQTPSASEASHLFFANALSAGWLNLMATHPPLAERIRRLDPSFQGQIDAAGGQPAGGPASAFDNAASGVARATGLASAAPAAVTRAADPATVVASAGTINRDAIDWARELLGGLPAVITEASHNAFAGRAVIHGLLLSTDTQVRQIQLDHLQRHADEQVYAELRRLMPQIRALPRQVHLPLVELTLPALRQLSAAQQQTFQTNIVQLINADNRVSLFEFALHRLVRSDLDNAARRNRTGKAGAGRNDTGPAAVLPDLNESTSLVLSALARVGHGNSPAAKTAFASALTHLALRKPPVLLAAADIDLRQVDRALTRLAELVPRHKRRLIAAATACVASDGRVTLEEGELLRAIAAALHVPIPPFIR